MIRNFRLNPVLVCLGAFATMFCLASSRADAQIKPFKIKGVGVAPHGLPLPGQEPRPHWIVGKATHLGLHFGFGSVKTDSADFSQIDQGIITGEFGSGTPFTFIGKHRNKLVCHYGRTDFGAKVPGTFELTILDILPDGNLVVEALFIAEFVPQTALCTGKFKGVTGSWTMYAWTDPFVLGSDDPIEYAWEGEGKLNFQK